MKGRTAKADSRTVAQNLTASEEEVLVRYILDLDSRGLSPSIDGVREMADQILGARSVRRVGKLWPNRFIQRRVELRTRFPRAYDFQRALCEDPDVLNAWFRLFTNMRAKYGILDCDLYNFDETGFMMGMIKPSMVVTRSDRRGKSKQVQPGNMEWATVISCIGADGFDVSPFILVPGQYHLSNWYTQTSMPASWVIKPTPNGWTDNETSVDWIKHFDQHTKSRRMGGYRMLVLDGHESHRSINFERYCTEQNIIPICLPPHSSHLTQPLDVGCFGPLKTAYGKGIEVLIRSHVTHISKVEFFSAFTTAYKVTMTKGNIAEGFRGAGLVPFNPEAVISKLDVRLRTPTPMGLTNVDSDPWISQTPRNPTEAISKRRL